MKKQNKVIFIGIVAVIILLAIVLTSAVSGVGKKLAEDKSLEDLVKNLDVNTAELVKAPVQVESNNNLYDELPEIEKYPLTVKGNGEVDIEIFTSGEKAGEGNDSWLIKMAKEFNDSGVVTSDGNSVTISVRSINSGTGADYIISGKYLPDLYTPSNTLFGEYCISQGGKLEILAEKLVGNTAGLLVTKDSGYENADDVIKAVSDGKLNIGYTNPQTSATGLNLLTYILVKNGGVTSDYALEAFKGFNSNIPYVAYTTQQMRDSASNGSLDGMVTEYQTYINDNNLQSMYDFVPFGIRHDNPLYIVNKNSKSTSELEAIEEVKKFLLSSESQGVATDCGFNKNEDYKSDYTVSGSEVSKSFEIYKSEKDNGKDIIAVFIADCSGSMSGDPMLQLKESLSNGASYINSNNYIGLVSYSNEVTIEVPIAKFDLNQRSYFQGALNRLQANGSTASYEAICVGLNMIEEARKDNPDAKCMLFLLSDGQANGWYTLNTIRSAVKESEVPIYTIGYTSYADTEALNDLSSINEAASISADSDDIIYKIKSLFNSQL